MHRSSLVGPKTYEDVNPTPTPTLTPTSSKEKSQKSCCAVWCCPGRCAWFKNLFVGVVVFFAIFSFVISLWAWSQSSFATSYKTYTTNGGINTWPAQHILAASIPLEMTLPNNLLEFIGAEYHIDCASPLAHSITIIPGVLSTTWDGTNRVLTCNASPAGGAGISFRVVTPTLIRIISSRNVVFN
jgi:hypothetical protein